MKATQLVTRDADLSKARPPRWAWHNRIVLARSTCLSVTRASARERLLHGRLHSGHGDNFRVLCAANVYTSASWGMRTLGMTFGRRGCTPQTPTSLVFTRSSAATVVMWICAAIKEPSRMGYARTAFECYFWINCLIISAAEWMTGARRRCATLCYLSVRSRLRLILRSSAAFTQTRKPTRSAAWWPAPARSMLCRGRVCYWPYTRKMRLARIMH